MFCNAKTNPPEVSFYAWATLGHCSCSYWPTIDTDSVSKYNSTAHTVETCLNRKHCVNYLIGHRHLNLQHILDIR